MPKTFLMQSTLSAPRVDEAILASGMNIREIWERRPLQLVLFGDQLAGEHFFDKLEAARNGGSSRINALEVFHMCLLVGFKGRYLLEGPEKLKYLTAQLGEQIAHHQRKGRRLRPPLGRPGQHCQRHQAQHPCLGHHIGTGLARPDGLCRA